MRRRARIWLCGLGLVAGCSSGTSTIGPEARVEARRIWKERCTNCHGPQGRGDGPQARYLNTSPRQLSDPAWQSSVTDEHLRRVIVQGGPAVGLDVAMAPNPDLRDRPEVLEALVQHVRGL